VLLVAAAFVDGFTELSTGVVRILRILVFASTIVLWCTLDAIVHGKLFLRSFAWTMMFTWPVGVLVHLVWTRRWRGVAVYVGATFVLAIAYLCGSGVAELLR
jgi:hypothetical protein